MSAASRMVPQAVLLDAVGTLIHPREPVADTYGRLGREFGSRLSVDQIRLRFGERFSVHFRQPGGITDEPGERQRWFRLVCEVFTDVPHPAPLFECLWDYFACPRSWAVFTDVPAALEYLSRRGVPASIASNFDRRLPAVVRELPELQPIDAVFCSSDVGWSKPDLRFFKEIARRLLVPPGQLAMIGDDAELDVRAARRAGWQAAHLDRPRDQLPGLLQQLLDPLEIHGD